MSHHWTLEEITNRNIELISKLESGTVSRRTFGQRVADQAAAVIGSWTFLIIQSLLLVGWMVVNMAGWVSPWDPYPFILLNLALSFQAAFATPLILMSQNRQAQLSERRNQLDLQINLLAEQETTEQLKLLRLLCEHSGIKIPRHHERAFEQSVKPDAILRQLDQGSNPSSTTPNGKQTETSFNVPH